MPLLGIIPDDKEVLRASNLGTPVVGRSVRAPIVRPLAGAALWSAGRAR